jgi:hypothetical protein
MMANLVPRASASSIEWVVTIKAEFLLSSLIDFHNNLLEYGSTPALDSSRKIICGLAIIEIAVTSFLLFPPLSFPALESKKGMIRNFLA